MTREEYERAYKDAFGTPRHARTTGELPYGDSRSAPFGSTQVLPSQSQPVYGQQVSYGYQRPESAASPYQPYGMPTANSQQYDQWANQQRPGNEFNMQRGKKKGCKRPIIIILVILLIIVLGVGIGAFLFLGHIDKIIGLGKNKDDVNLALVDRAAGEPYYVLLIGNDSREGMSTSDAEWAGKAADGSDGQADVMILARIDEPNHKVTLLTIPRDTPWQSEDGSWGKLKDVFRDKGAGALIKAVSQLTGVPVSHYAEIHMSGFINLVDAVGGIDIDVPITIDYHEALTNEQVHIDAGYQHLNGVQAEVFARERNTYETDLDMNRQNNVRNIVKSIYDKVKQKPAWELPGVVTACAECVTTDMNSVELVAMIAALGGNPEMLSGTGPYAGDENPNANNQWLCFVDEEGWARVMDVVKSGGDPSTVSYEGDDVYAAGSR